MGKTKKSEASMQNVGTKTQVSGNVDTVCVALNRPLGLRFVLPDGRDVCLNGNGTGLIGKDAGILPVGTYGLTVVPKADWDWITANFGGMKVFTSGLCFAADSKADAEKEAESRSSLRNGWEPVDVAKTATKTATPGEL